MANAPVSADAPDKLAKTLFFLVAGGAVAFCAVVVVFILL